MIVRCPSCSTRYRHQPPAGAIAAALAECSRCDERFPLRPAGRSYVVVAGSASAAPLPQPALGAAAPSAPGRERRPLDLPRRGSERPLGLGFAAEERDAESDRRRQDVAPAAPPRSALIEFLIALVPPCVGASLAYHLAQRGQLDPVAWSALGGAFGFLLGWGCLLWIRRND